MLKKKIFGTLFALSLGLSLASCGLPAATTTDTGGSEEISTPKDTASPESTPAESTTTELENAKLGVLYQLTDDETPIISKAKLKGNRYGSDAGINGYDYSTDKIRSIFEILEWVTISLESTKKELSYFVIPHQEDNSKITQASEENALYSGTLTAPEEEVEEWGWGDFYLNSDEASAGYYDLVFQYNEKNIAKIVLKFYDVDELSGKTDEEIESMMEAENA